jgi:hypothetical protein
MTIDEVSWEKTKVRHGTASGARKHSKLGEEACDSCRRAKSEYDKKRRLFPKIKQKNQNSAMAQNRARTRLVNLYPDLYRKFYAEELKAITEEYSNVL